MSAEYERLTADGLPSINREAPIPLHHQVRAYLLSCIERGELQPGQQLLQEREYAARFGISLAPVRQAILDLVKEGLRAKGLKAVLRVVALRLVNPPPTLRQALQHEDQHFVFLQRVASVEGEAIALLSSYLAARLVPELETLDFNGRSLYKTVEERYGIVLARAENTIEVVRCHGNQATLLGIAPGTPMLQVEGKTYDIAGRFVEFAQVLYRADRFRFTIESFRRDERVLHLIGAPDAEEGTHT
jgi:GntR family transcriptional regulator